MSFLPSTMLRACPARSSRSIGITAGLLACSVMASGLFAQIPTILGTTPVTGFEVAPNQQNRLSLRLNGYQPLDTTFVALASGEQRLNISMKPVAVAAVTPTQQPAINEPVPQDVASVSTKISNGSKSSLWIAVGAIVVGSVALALASGDGGDGALTAGLPQEYR